jgi:hypothetical protein
MKNPYKILKSTLIPSYVCLIDIMGFKELSIKYFKIGKGNVFLRKIKEAVDFFIIWGFCQK